MITEAAFTARARKFEPAYLRLGVPEIQRRAAEAVAALASCQACPRNCRVDRLHDRTAVCKSGRHALVSSYFPHFGEEDCLRGWKGSGTIFFSWCNLRCVFCVDADAHIVTDHGVVRIEDSFLSSGREVAVNGGKIRFPEGLHVYTRNGELAPVAKAFCHPYRGEMVVVKPYGLPPLRVTPDHPVFAVSPPESECRKIPAGELTQAHLLVVPKLRSAAGSVQLDVRAVLEPYVKDFRRSVWRRVSVKALKELARAAAAGRLTSRQMGGLLGYHPAYVRGLLSRLRRGKIQEDGELIRNDLVEEDGRLRFKTEKGQGVPSKLSMSLGLGRLLGYYCAEGHVTSPKDRPNSHRLIFSFGLHEEHLAERTRVLLQKVFGVEPTLVRRRTTVTVEVGSASLALLFCSLCGHRSREKRVPSVLLAASDDAVRAFLEAYWEGDGCRQGAYLSASTVSRDLALGLTALLLRIGVFPYFYEARQSRHRVIEGRTVTQSERLYYVKCRSGAWEGTTCGGKVRYLETHEAFLAPIRRISRSWYEGPVYNLEVGDDDHSYVAQGVAVGNCQNSDISQKGEGAVVTPERLADMMLELQTRGCHNINFVTPEHVVPQILEALPLAIRGGLRLPIVYNTSAYDSLESLRWMDGIVDIYMPDFKVWTDAVAKRYLKAPDYPEAARRAIREMHEQVGPLVVDESGLAKRGLLVRHLVMPGMLEETRRIMTWLARELSPNTYVNVMAQYYPAGTVSSEKYPEINRKLFQEEYEEAVRIARDAGLWRLDERYPRLRLFG